MHLESQYNYLIAKIQDFCQFQYSIDPFAPRNGILCLSFSCNLIGYLNQALKSDWLSCFSVPSSLAGEMVRAIILQGYHQ